MSRFHFRVIGMVLCLAFGVTACGGTDEPRRQDDPCDAITCEANATCDAATKACVCDAGYDDVDGACVAVETMNCTDVAPDNATSTVVEVTEPTDCGWICDTGYIEENGECFADEETIFCTDEAPDNATSTVVAVDEPAVCAWTCNTGYVEENGACVEDATLYCTDEAPDNATSDVVEVTEATVCEWSCDEGYLEEDGACVEDTNLYCTDVSPDNATSTVVVVDEATECDWSCNDGYLEEDGACVEDTNLYCTDVSPDNATSTVVVVDEATECDWSCNDGFVEDNDACVEDTNLYCTDVAPNNGTSTVVVVDEATECEWSCDTGYGEVEGECLDKQTVSCVDDPPTGATSTVEDVEIQYVDGEWTEPATCAWTCDDAAYHAEGDACVANVAVDWCNTHSPSDITTVLGLSFEIYGRVYSDAGTTGVGRLEGITAMVCHTYDALSTPVDLTAATCFDASYVGDVGGLNAGDLANDEYMAEASFETIGLGQYFYAFSGDGGDNWTFCDLDGELENSDNVGSTTVTGPTNGGFENWDATNSLPLDWVASDGVGVALETTDVRTGSSAVELTRNSTDNAATEFSSTLQPIVGGHEYIIDMWFLEDTDHARGRHIHQWYDENGVSLANASFGAYTVNSPDWQVLSRTVTAPANAHFVRVATRIYTEGEATGGSVILDDVTITPVAP
ncbi:MAG: hypothetical protein ACNA8W_08680 [Bradymonadaceae bacterium]